MSEKYRENVEHMKWWSDTAETTSQREQFEAAREQGLRLQDAMEKGPDLDNPRGMKAFQKNLKGINKTMNALMAFPLEYQLSDFRSLDTWSKNLRNLNPFSAGRAGFKPSPVEADHVHETRNLADYVRKSGLKIPQFMDVQENLAGLRSKGIITRPNSNLPTSGIPIYKWWHTGYGDVPGRHPQWDPYTGIQQGGDPTKSLANWMIKNEQVVLPFAPEIKDNKNVITLGVNPQGTGVDRAAASNAAMLAATEGMSNTDAQKAFANIVDVGRNTADKSDIDFLTNLFEFAQKGKRGLKIINKLPPGVKLGAGAGLGITGLGLIGDLYNVVEGAERLGEADAKDKQLAEQLKILSGVMGVASLKFPPLVPGSLAIGAASRHVDERAYGPERRAAERAAMNLKRLKGQVPVPQITKTKPWLQKAIEQFLLQGI